MLPAELLLSPFLASHTCTEVILLSKLLVPKLWLGSRGGLALFPEFFLPPLPGISLNGCSIKVFMLPSVRLVPSTQVLTASGGYQRRLAAHPLIHHLYYYQLPG